MIFLDNYVSMQPGSTRRTPDITTADGDRARGTINNIIPRRPRYHHAITPSNIVLPIHRDLLAFSLFIYMRAIARSFFRIHANLRICVLVIAPKNRSSCELNEIKKKQPCYFCSKTYIRWKISIHIAL